MARRRKSTGSGKTKDVTTVEKRSSKDAEYQNNDKNMVSSISTPPTFEQPSEETKCLSENEVDSNTDQSQSSLMPLDIQQMILGDLQSVGQGDEIIVSREGPGDISEDVEELEGETETVLETSREEEYEIHTEEDEEEELILMNEDDDGEENQYVIVVNSDFEVTDDASQEVVSIHNLSDFQDGSCEIITVVRESDYESSQESVDGMDEECGEDNINTVIGTVGGIHCVNISQYNSDEEGSNEEESLEKEEIHVIEHETEIKLIHNHMIDEEEDDDHREVSACEISTDEEAPSSNKMSLENTENKVDVKDSIGMDETKDKSFGQENLVVKTENGSCTNEKSQIEMEVKEASINSNPETSNLAICDVGNNKDIKIETNKESKENDLVSNISTMKEEGNKSDSLLIYEHKSATISTLSSRGKDRIEEISQNSEVEKEKSDNKQLHVSDSSATNLRETRKGRSKAKSVSNNNLGSLKLDRENKISPTKEESELSVNIKSVLKNIQENTVTSNFTACEITSNKDSPTTGSTKNTNMQKNKNSFTPCARISCKESVVTDSLHTNTQKKENVSSSSSFECLSIPMPSDKGDSKVDLTKEEVALKEEDDKQSTFRSRSGSTDTTGSESGSNSSSSRRRSGRIRSFGNSKQSDHSAKSVGNPSVPVVTSTTTPPVPGYESDKPVKVKSRWRRSSELEMGSNNKRHQETEVINANVRLIESTESVSTPTPPRPAQPSTPPDTPPPDKEVEDVLAQFQHLDCNEYLTERSKSKEAKRMVCDCTLTKEEIARGDMGCGEDCLNRLLMIECGTRCMLGESCANKRFQNLEYAKCEVFKTEMKGCGLKALEDIPADTFLLEYVGEVLDPKEFRRRAKDYAKDKNRHYYFMALKSDSIIDATQKGNISRFINHSCDPNAETQKWTVNGELRVGFFSKRPISAGEEITFDYQLQRYGKEAQRCHCQASSCRGWIGEDPEKENKWSDISGRNRERKEKERKKREDKRKEKDMLNDIDLQEEIEKLVLKNRAQTLLHCRLMVRAEDHDSRSQLLNILQRGETACLRLFLDYHGLRLIWSWMMDPATNSALKVEILETLAKLPIQNKTMLQDSKVLNVVEKWATSGLNVAEAKDRSSTEDDSDKAESERDKQVKASDLEKSSDDSNQCKPVEDTEQQENNIKKIIELANSLLKEWASLKEVFRIPKKERIEQMKEHEREADRLVFRDSSVEKQDKSYDRHWSRSEYDRRDKDRDKDRKRGRGDSPDSDKSRKAAKVDDKQSHLTKMERRQLFAIKAAQEEEDRLRRQQENMWQEQVQLAAHELAAAQQANNFVPPSFPPPHQWMPYPHPDGNMLPPQHMEGQHMFAPNNPPFPFNQNGPPIHQHPPFLDPNHNSPFLDPNHNSPFHNPVNPMFNHPPPLPKQPLLPTPTLQPLLPNPPLPNQPLLPTPNQPLLPNPPLPTQPYIPPQQNQPLLMTPSLPNQPHQISLPPFTQPPLPNHPPPLSTSQPPPTFPVQDVNAPKQFQNVPQQNQFSQPPPFTTQPPLPKLPPTPSTVPAQFPSTAVVPVTTAAVPTVPVYLPVKLPPKWKSAKDAVGRTYYYHVKTRKSQWEPPLWDSQQTVVQESDSESDSSDSDEDSSSNEEKDDDEEEEEEEDKVEEHEEEEEEEIHPVEASHYDDDLGCQELGDSPYEPETMELLEDIEYDSRKKRRDVLVQERIISPRTEDEIPEKLDKRKIRELKERLRRQKAKEKLRLKLKNKSKGRSGTSKCEADTSSDPGRKIKDAFRLNMAGVIVHHLNAYRKPDCKIGKITNTEDFKHLARKLTHFVMLKELKHCRSVDELDCNDNVKHKARDFIKKYMAKFGAEYSRPSDDD